MPDHNVKRRSLLLSAAVLAAGRTLVACGSSGGGTAGSQSDVWVVSAVLYAGQPSIVVDLSSTLPAGTKQGGTFGVDSSGAALPSGVSLSSDGILSLDSAASVGVTQGVVFSYTEPA